MRKLLIFFCSLFGFTNNIQSQNRNINLGKSDLDWELVDKILKSHIENKKSFSDGVKDFENLLNLKEFQLINNLEYEKLNIEFKQFIQKTVTENKTPSNIKAINFGIFTSIEKKKEFITIYISGSAISPTKDSYDWNVDPIYFPKFYFIPTYFEMIKNSNPNMDANIEVLIFNGILNLLILNNTDFLSNELLKNNDKLYLGSGFDSGETYILGILSDKGLY